jgi:putative ABC transport system substrate-binding protein
MDRRTFTAGCVGSVALSLRAARAQPAGHPWRIGFLAGGLRPADGLPPAALRDELRALGLAEGREAVYESRWGQGRLDDLSRVAAELASKVDVLVAFGAAAAETAKRTISTVPVVVVSAGDLVETGMVASLAHPGGNVTGVNDPAKDLSAKRLQILKELVPGAVRIAVLWNAGNLAMTLRYREIERAATVLGLRVEPLGVREPDDFDAALAAMTRTRPDALMMVTDALTNLNRRRVLDYVRANRIPAMYEFSGVVRDGGLASYGSEPSEGLELAARQVARILRGARAGDLPVEQPSHYLLVINLETAKALELTIPSSLLQRADETVR